MSAVWVSAVNGALMHIRDKGQIRKIGQSGKSGAPQGRRVAGHAQEAGSVRRAEGLQPCVQQPWWVAVQQRLPALSRWAGLRPEVEDDFGAVLEHLTRNVAHLAGPPYAGLSTINASGMPFQWSASLGAPRAVRCLCETGPVGASVFERAVTGLRLLDEARAWIGQAPSQALQDVVAPELLPKAAEVPAHWRSALWIGLGAAQRGVRFKPYFNLNRGTPLQRWQRVARVLAGLGWGESLRRCCELSARVSEGSWPVGLALDLGTDASVSRMKVYFRGDPASRAWLERWYCAVHGAGSLSPLRDLLDALPCPGGRLLPPGSMVLSLEFHAEGALSLKTDLGVTRWLADDIAIRAGTRRLLDALGLPTEALDDFLRACGQLPEDACPTSDHLRFVGLGLEPDGSRHVNVYTEPVTALPAAPNRLALRVASRPQGVSAALHRALDFLQTRGGGPGWHDFELPVGSADEWVTAYVLAALGRLQADSLSKAMRSRAYAAAAWLAQVERPQGGWGYNRSCPVDADSTAWGVLALRAWAGTAPAKAVQRLAMHVDAAGGARTYVDVDEAAGGWGQPRLDIAATVLSALSNESAPAPLLTRLAARLRSDLSLERATGYWWVSSLYADAMAIHGCPVWLGAETIELLRRRARRYSTSSDFELALQALVMAGCDDVAHPVTKLLNAQADDGSWAPTALLRLTDRDVVDPAARLDAGPLYTDTDRVFTTTTAVLALHLASGVVRRR